MTQLTTQLKALKLSGIIDTLDVRLMEAQQNQLSYSEFVSMLLSDEIEKRNMNKVARLIRKANLNPEKTLENFDFSFNPSINAALIRELSTCRFLERAEGIFFLGPTGTGKTHLAKAICHQACRQFFTVAFYSFQQLLQEFQLATIKIQLPKLLHKLVRLDLLTMDDFGFQKKIDQQAAEFLHTIVDALDTVLNLLSLTVIARLLIGVRYSGSGYCQCYFRPISASI